MHRASRSFWDLFNELPANVQRIARRNFRLLVDNPLHPSLHFKRVGPGEWSVRIGRRYRATGYEDGDGITWTWIGPHDEYDERLSS